MRGVCGCMDAFTSIGYWKLGCVSGGAIASNGVNGSRKACTETGVCSSGSGIQGDFDLSNFEDGVLSSAFMVGLLVASPIFASLAKRLVGVGEASFISLAAPFIDDNAPVAQKTAWLAAFYMCIPTGIALGYVYGGLFHCYLHVDGLTSVPENYVGNSLSWRYAFWGEALLMLPFAILGFTIKPLQLKVSPLYFCRSLGARKFVNQIARFWRDMKMLLVEKIYVINVLGICLNNSYLHAFSFD
ncbi:putative sphingolipid transporter spinster like 3 [Apostasia shenzhenica]|uniref:Putative sphingolipid transporter spinster like 3 n=1 Tax=Apostasia shenzhenica TaxID=1088818 RepID=A0A2I0AED0_9ASPA|nr:putative sphingolipid transporter spinster like 3 [Apostasia shenzhenica]